MTRIEQAIYTSAQTSRSSGYQLVVHSPGIDDADVRELSAWGPSHDSLWETGQTALSVNFHRLPSGAFCISQTTTAGEEFSQRRGPQLYTQQLVVSPEGFARFANNPFALLQAAIAAGHMQVVEKFPKQLEPLVLAADVPAANCHSLAQLAAAEGAALVLHAALHAPSLGLVAGERGPRLIAALFNALPVECRTDFTFTTGLRFSPRRTFRLICLPDSKAENQRFARQYNMTLLDLTGHVGQASRLSLDNRDGRPTLTGWAAFVSEAIQARQTSGLAEELNQPHPGLTLESLDVLGERLRAAQTGASCSREEACPAPESLPMDQPDTVASQDECASPCEAPAFVPATVAAASRFEGWQRADGHHAQAMQASSVIADAYCREVEMMRDTLHIAEEPALVLAERCPSALQTLQQLEDTIFEAMAGKAAALEELRPQWKRVLDLMGRTLAESAREQYLCYALAVWRQFSAGDDIGDPNRAANAMEVICLLFDR